MRKAGDVDGARTTSQYAIDCHADHSPDAAVKLGALLAKEGDAEGAGLPFRGPSTPPTPTLHPSQPISKSRSGNHNRKIGNSGAL